MIIKNSNLRRNLFSNRYKILAIIIAIILVIFLVRALNNMAIQSNIKQNNQQYTTPQSTYKPQETIIQGENISKEEQEINTNIMDTFIKYCNSKNIEQAYNLLTEECKEELFNSDIENFKTQYIEKVFNTPKTYSMQSWVKSGYSTYKVRIIEDMLSTGKVGDVIEEYYTIVRQNGQDKLNLNSYIGREKINKQQTINDITITVISKDIYMNYETYNIKVENKTNNTMLLDTKKDTKSVYVTGSNTTKYSVYMHEIDDIFLTIKPRLYRNLKLKVNKLYNTEIKSEKITFTDIVPNIEDYKQSNNKKEYNDTIKLEIEL